MSHDAIRISSLRNARVRQALKLRDRAERDRTGLFIVEGRREVGRALASGCRAEAVFYCGEFFADGGEGELVRACAEGGAQTWDCAPEVFRKLAYGDRPEGVLVVARQRPMTLADLAPGPSPLLVAAEGVEKPGNLGAILRCADAAGVEGVLVCDGRTDMHNPNVVRASAGLLFAVPVAEATSAAAIAWMRDRRVRILAATPHAEKDYTRADMRGAMAIVVGTEKSGLSPQWTRAADETVRIPMRGKGDSLNVAAALAVLLFEAVRQRQVNAAGL